MKRLMTGAAAITTSLLLGIGGANADDGKSSHSDASFFKHTAQGGIAEVKLGQLAVNKGESEAVKNFGRRMVDDHSKANKELQDLAAAEGVTLPSEMNAEAKALHEKLLKLTGVEFDKTYMNEMLKDHQKDIAAFKKQAEQGNDVDVKNWAAKILPTLQEHYTLAQTTSTQIGAKSGVTSDSADVLGSMDQSSR